MNPKNTIKIFGFGILLCCFGILGCNLADEGRMLHYFLGIGPYEGPYWPTEGWRSCAPEEVGMDSDALRAAYEYAANPNLDTRGIIVIKDGYIVGEAYFSPYEQDDLHPSFSIAKSFTSALVGIAIDQGLIPDVEHEAYHYFPEWQTVDTPTENQLITIEFLLTMTSGLAWLEEDYYSSTSDDDIYRMYQEASDFIDYVLAKPVIHDPGTEFYYSSGSSILLAGIVEAVSGMRAADYATEHLFGPLGITNISWEADPAGHTIGGWGIDATVRDFAKFGYLYLNRGQWDGEQIVSEEWVTQSTSSPWEGLDYYGYHWWLLPAFGNYESYGIPEDTYFGVGIYVQRLYVVPEENLVVVRMGNDGPGSGENWNTLTFLQLILDAIVE